MALYGEENVKGGDKKSRPPNKMEGAPISLRSLHLLRASSSGVDLSEALQSLR